MQSHSMDNKSRLLSQQQADYFKDSIVRDENGKLLTMYHGSSYDFDVFDKEHIRAFESDAPYNGFWFSDDEHSLPAWTRLRRRFEVYIDLKNPAPMALVRKVNKEIQEERNAWQEIPTDDGWHAESRSTCDELRLRLKDMGYDGIIHDWKPDVNREELERTGRTVVTTTRGRKYLLEKDEENGCLDLYYYDPYEEDHRGENLTGYDDLDDYLRLQERTVVVFEPQQIKSVYNRTPSLAPEFKYDPTEEGMCPDDYVDIAHDFGTGYIVKAMFVIDSGIKAATYPSFNAAIQSDPDGKIIPVYCVAEEGSGKVPNCVEWHTNVDNAISDYYRNIHPMVSKGTDLDDRIEYARKRSEQLNAATTETPTPAIQK